MDGLRCISSTLVQIFIIRETGFEKNCKISLRRVTKTRVSRIKTFLHTRAICYDYETKYNREINIVYNSSPSPNSWEAQARNLQFLYLLSLLHDRLLIYQAGDLGKQAAGIIRKLERRGRQGRSSRINPLNRPPFSFSFFFFIR